MTVLGYCVNYALLGMQYPQQVRKKSVCQHQNSIVKVFPDSMLEVAEFWNFGAIKTFIEGGLLLEALLFRYQMWFFFSTFYVNILKDFANAA